MTNSTHTPASHETANIYALAQLASLCDRNTILYAAAECRSNAAAAASGGHPLRADDYNLAADKLVAQANHYHPVN